MLMETINVKKCCALCQFLYNRDKCPLCGVYNYAAECGNDEFELKVKYEIFCGHFELHKMYT